MAQSYPKNDPQYETLSSSSTKTTEKSSGSLKWVGWIILIVIILFVIFAVWYIVHRSLTKRPTNNNTNACTGQTCSGSQVCNGAGNCANSDTVVNVGSPCTANSNCYYGNICTSNYCVPSTTVVFTPTNPFQLTTTLTSTITAGANLYYLTIVSTSNGKNILGLNTQSPNYKINYNPNTWLFSTSSNLEGTRNSPQNVGFTAMFFKSDAGTGNLELASDGYPLALITSGNNLYQIQHPCGSILGYNSTTILAGGTNNIPIKFPQSCSTCNDCPVGFDSSGNYLPITFAIAT